MSMSNVMVIASQMFKTKTGWWELWTIKLNIASAHSVETFSRLLLGRMFQLSIIFYFFIWPTYNGNVV